MLVQLRSDCCISFTSVLSCARPQHWARKQKLRKRSTRLSRDTASIPSQVPAIMNIASANELCSLGLHHLIRKRFCAACIQVWKLRTGQCIRRFEKAHGQGVTSVAFSRDASHVLSSSYDGLARVHGLKSGKMLKEFRGHTSYVNQAIYSQDSNQVRLT